MISKEEKNKVLEEAMNGFKAEVNYHAPKGTWLPLNGSPD